MATSAKASYPEKIGDVLDDLLLRDNESRNALKRELRQFSYLRYHDDRNLISQLDDEELEASGTEFLLLNARRNPVSPPTFE